ncbi:MAG: GatB/YqeY domain-containing protein [Campylobacterota bacterium]|nr:GatB/YqeY domain-containing protein [Campylobacterota bacterium]
MSLKVQLKSDLKEAMKAKDINRRDSIRSINTMIKQVEVDERRDLSDDDVIKLLQRGIKQREESIVQYSSANRDDLVNIEQGQIDIFMHYMPKQLDESELEVAVANIIEQTGAQSMKDMGKVMGAAKATLGGSADGKRINEMVKKLLG